MSRYYQQQDFPLFDYGMVQSKGVWHRGPLTVASKAQAIAIGSAHTFGRFSAHAYCDLLRTKYDFNVLNFGFEGAAPASFLVPEKLEVINSHPLVIVQVLSGRSVTNSFFQCRDGSRLKILKDGLKADTEKTRKVFSRANQVKLALGDKIKTGGYLPAKEAWNCVLAQMGADFTENLVRETRGIWVAEMRRLLAAIRGKKVLLWFSVRAPEYDLGFDSVESVFGEFPQLVNREMLTELMGSVDDYIEVVNSEGYPVTLPPPPPGSASLPAYRHGNSRRYPSEAMHMAAADAIAKHLLP